MKPFNIILLIISAFTLYFIQLWEPQYVAPLYLMLLSVCFIFGLKNNDINLTHISLFLVVINGIEYITFTKLIDPIAQNNDYLSKGTIIFGLQFVINLVAVCVFIFRVQLSKKLFGSSKVSLTDFDAFFHWFFILSAFNCLLALAENTVRNIYDIDFQFFYDLYPIVAYLLWALTFGALITMAYCSIKERNTIIE
ncbi:hypothetical protein [Pseudoalteromonas umbrosa]|uniref:hypothetical protein n=1 Tax=Pseudoalteromonas umbrosa TaxID=3048489 RepID=UPI0024C22259|nr:hypothetical protein [Pseudoalteromonas sp. B95]MDK1288603.1 hypothetical protein [Pseudoalteromonas sp. B95]